MSCGWKGGEGWENGGECQLVVRGAGARVHTHTLHRGGECSVPSVMLQHVEPVASYNHPVTALC